MDDTAQVIKKWTETGWFGRTKHRMLLKKVDGTVIWLRAWSDEYHTTNVGDWVQHDSFGEHERRAKSVQ